MTIAGPDALPIHGKRVLLVVGAVHTGQSLERLADYVKKSQPAELRTGTQAHFCDLDTCGTLAAKQEHPGTPQGAGLEGVEDDIGGTV